VATSLLALLVVWGPAASAVPPDEGECPTVSAGPEDGDTAEDATPLVLEEGMIVDKQGLLALRRLLPKEVWRNREVFFFEGMRLLIGPCHRRYRLPGFYRDATKKFAGQPSIDKHGNLRDYTAGTPFPPGAIDPNDTQAGIKWAWNFEKRFRGAGHKGSFRITSVPGRVGRVERYRGDFFIFQAAERADLAKTDYRWPGAKKKLWAAGGYFSAPFNARELAWRQFRPIKAERRWEQSDDIFVYVPTMRKMRRAATGWVDGAYMPRYLVSGQSGGGGVNFGESGSINPSAGPSIATTEDARAGLTGLFIRPNAYHWRLNGEKTVLAPLNGSNEGYPLSKERNYGYSGLSMANDRWDVRHAVVIEGASKRSGDTIRTLTIFVDYHTLQPLYWITRTSRRRVIEVGILVHRYTGDLARYPDWPDGTQALVFEPVAAGFYNSLEGAGGWLRESYDLVSLPYSESERKKMTTSDGLQRGR
jgi:hypothetical protein